MYPKAKEDFQADAVMDMVELTTYSFHRELYSYERLKNAGYPNAEALEVRYREMMG